MGPQASPLELGASPIRFAIHRLRAYPPRMPTKPIELPPEVAKAFRDMRAFFAGGTGVKADEIAARQLHARQHSNGKLRLIDVREMLLQMRDVR